MLFQRAAELFFASVTFRQTHTHTPHASGLSLNENTSAYNAKQAASVSPERYARAVRESETESPAEIC